MNCRRMLSVAFVAAIAASLSTELALAQQTNGLRNPVDTTLALQNGDTDRDATSNPRREERSRRRAERGDARNNGNQARGGGRGQQQPPPPTMENVPYGDHKRNVLDFWQAESDKPTPLFVWIHGGGFRGGDKSPAPGELVQACLDAGISCASINYRLTDVAPYPAQMLDSARAIQFLRSKASEWNLNPELVAAGGGSAGSGISQWLAFHDDLAKPDSDDLVERQSTRLVCAVAVAMQSTYDPRVIKEIIPGKAYEHPALPPFFAVSEDWDFDTDEISPELDARMKDASPITHLTSDDVPVFAFHNASAATPNNIHHPNFGKHLEEAMNKLHIECVRRLDSDYESKNAAYKDMVEFLKKHFTAASKSQTSR